MENDTAPSSPVAVIAAILDDNCRSEPACLDLGGPSLPMPLDLSNVPDEEIDENPPKRLRRSPIPSSVETKSDIVAQVADAPSVVDAELPSNDIEPGTSMNDESVHKTLPEESTNIIDLTGEEDLEVESSSFEKFCETPVSRKKFLNSANKNETVIDLTDEDDTYSKTKIDELKHPAPLPQTYQKVFPRGKPLLPAPIVKVSPLTSSVRLSWSMKMTREMPAIQLFEVFYYEELPAMESIKEPWKKMMDIPYNLSASKCDLNKLTENRSKSKFHLSVRAVDVLNRMGPFSVVKTINYGD